jgi:acyl-CoA hydrolase
MYRKEYSKKRISVEDAVLLIKTNNHLVLSGGPIEPWSFIEKMPILKNAVRDVRVSNVLSLKAHEVMINAEYKGVFEFEACFYSGVQRITEKLGYGSHVPTHLRNAASGILRQNSNPDIFVVTVSPMDKNGFFTTGPGVIYDFEMIQKAKVVIVEVNERFPRTFGDTLVHISDVDYIYEVDRPVPGIPDSPITDIDKRIGEYVSELIEDGSTIQLGIGAIPNAAAKELIHKKDLGIHTEMLNDAMVDLYYAGAITGKRKNVFPQKIITSFTMGSKKVYDFIDDNPLVFHFRPHYTNNPFIVGSNNKMVSINTTLQIDFTGQCASESIKNVQISGTGGQVETSIGAQMSNGGKSIITLHSTAYIKKKGEDKKIRVSKIIPFLEEGTIVTLTRTDVEYVVTEYGVACLKGASVRERTKMLINIAHPDFREELTEKAKKYNFI